MPLGTALKIRNAQPHIWQVLVCAYAVRRVINVSYLTVSSCYPVITHTCFFPCRLPSSLDVQKRQSTPFFPLKKFLYKRDKTLNHNERWQNLGRKKPVALRTCFCASPTQCTRCSRMVHLSSSMCCA